MGHRNSHHLVYSKSPRGVQFKFSRPLTKKLAWPESGSKETLPSHSPTTQRKRMAHDIPELPIRKAHSNHLLDLHHGGPESYVEEASSLESCELVDTPIQFQVGPIGDLTQPRRSSRIRKARPRFQPDVSREEGEALCRRRYASGETSQGGRRSWKNEARSRSIRMAQQTQIHGTEAETSTIRDFQDFPKAEEVGLYMPPLTSNNPLLELQGPWSFRHFQQD